MEACFDVGLKSAFPGKYEEWPHPIFNRTGADLEVGSLVAFDIWAGATETTATEWTCEDDGGFGNAVTPAAINSGNSTGLFSGMFVLALSKAVDNASFRGLIQGKASMLVLPTAATSTEAFTPGARVVPIEGQVYGQCGNGTLGGTGVLAKTVAMIYETATFTGATPELKTVWFRGIDGFPMKS